MNLNDREFIYVCTQNGAEGVCKQEILRLWPKLRFAFSRPGFLTFKLGEGFQFEPRFDLKSVFARCCGFSVGKLTSVNSPEFAATLRGLLESFNGRHIHVWSRDLHLPGASANPNLRVAEAESQFYLPGTAAELGTLIDSISQVAASMLPDRFKVNCEANVNDKVFDAIMVEPDQIWTGWHVAASVPSRWPGGIPRIELPERMVSRAYLKICEALQWSRMPLRAGDCCVEIGAAPGGSSQALLALGMNVIGVDPAEMDAEIAAHPNFTSMRCRGAEVRCRDLKHVHWLFVDTNVAPNHTLDTVERIVTNKAVQLRGMILTVKLSNWELADEITAYLNRIRGWGFGYIKARQLAYNRHEFCIAAMRHKAMLRFGKQGGQPKRQKANEPDDVQLQSEEGSANDAELPSEIESANEA